MKETLEELKTEVLDLIGKSTTLDQLTDVETAYLKKKGKFSILLKSVGGLPPEERREVGKLANSIKTEINEALTEKQEELSSSIAGSGEAFDVTLPGHEPERGSLHPLTQMKYDLNEAFLSLGFEVFEGPEISSEVYGFDNLNFPDDHPARDSMDTYWIKGSESKTGAERLCLRPHLTGASVRYMQSHKPPFRFVYPGRVFRNESTDASHERAFFQYEALMVDKKVPFSSGQLMINTILEKVFGQKVKTRMRAGFFPFVEPGFEIDMQCLVCNGKGCSVCGQSGWLEMMPGGPPHPNVMRAGNIDSNEWQGFYINIGLDRLVMMRYAINDVRLLHSQDIRFLKQFA